MAARARVAAAGFFDALVSGCAQTLPSRVHPLGAILDAGSGEGSFLHLLAANLPDGAEVSTVGVDLAAEGVRLGASRWKTDAWLVADLAALPLTEGKFDVIVNVLSPANYSEFARVLAPRGLLIKVLPTERHLLEVRDALGLNAPYTNEPVADAFRLAFGEEERIRIEARLPCGPALAADLLEMTPLGWHATPAQVQQFVAAPPADVTVSFDVLFGRRAA